jgi:hypothetical protein
MKILGILLLIFVVWVYVNREKQAPPTTSPTVQSGGTATPEARKQEQEPPMVETPATVARKVLNASKESAASAEIEVDGDTLFVRYSIKPWSMTIDWTHDIFELHVHDLVKSEFAHFPYLMNIKVTAYGQFKDIRGNETTEDVLAAVFTRKNADTIKWGSIAYRNIPLIADDYWIHPQLARKKK